MKNLEIETIKERTFELKLSDADVKRLASKAAVAEITMEQLLTSLIGDLVDGTYSNGSDERDMAEQWFERCGYGCDKRTLLHFLIENDEIEYFLERREWAEECREEVELWEKDLTAANEKWSEIVDKDNKPCYKSVDEYIKEVTEGLEIAREELQAVEEEINDYWNSFMKWTEAKEPNKEKEIQAVIDWQKKLNLTRETI